MPRRVKASSSSDSPAELQPEALELELSLGERRLVAVLKSEAEAAGDSWNRRLLDILKADAECNGEHFDPVEVLQWHDVHGYTMPCPKSHYHDPTMLHVHACDPTGCDKREYDEALMPVHKDNMRCTPPPFPMMRLPIEIRTMIWRLYLDAPDLGSREWTLDEIALSPWRCQIADQRRLWKLRFRLRILQNTRLVSKAVAAEVQALFFSRTEFHWEGFSCARGSHTSNAVRSAYRMAVTGEFRILLLNAPILNHVQILTVSWGEDEDMIKRVIGLQNLRQLTLIIHDSRLYRQHESGKRQRDPQVINMFETKGALLLSNLRGLESFDILLRFTNPQEIERWENSSWWNTFKRFLTAMAVSPKDFEADRKLLTEREY